MKPFKGFWSYVHMDDEIEKGRISCLAHDVAGQFHLLKGEQLEFFLDKDDIKWGDDWKEKIDNSLLTIACFIPIITPLYFQSKECRRELQYFISRAKDLGITDLLLPIYYAEIPEIEQEETIDDLVGIIRSYQWEDWRELRFSSVDSECYRRGVAGLAMRLIEANKRVEGQLVPSEICLPEPHIDEDDEGLGTIDFLALTEEMFTSLPITLSQIAEFIKTVGQLMHQATEEIKEDTLRGSGFAARVVNARKLATRLEEPVNSILTLSNLFSTQLHDADRGIQIMIEQAPAEIRSSPENKKDICEFVQSLRSLASSSNESVTSFKEMIEVSRPLEEISRDLRPVLRKLTQGITILIEATGTINDWVSLLDKSDIDCCD